MPETATHSRTAEKAKPEHKPKVVEDIPPMTPEIFPILRSRDQLSQALKDHDILVLKAATGSGKSTMGPSVFLEALQQENPGRNVHMLVAEPRQMLAEEISDFVAKVHKTPLGGDMIGFYHGDDQKYSPDTQIVYTVTGSLKKRIEEDITLKHLDAIFLDEIHLRDADQEAILLGLKEVQKERKKHGLKPLKIVIASATPDEKFVTHFDNATMISVEGKKSEHTVTPHYATASTDVKNIPLEMARMAAKLIQDPNHQGDVLGFLPGRAEIKKATNEFNRIMREAGLGDKYKAAALTGGGGAENKAMQKQLADKNPNRPPIAAFATDVAEAGATFPRLTKVIDSGLVRTMIYNVNTGLDSLQTRYHALTQYIQRLGRVGRNADGDFYTMYTEADLNDASKHPEVAPPSILKEDLAPLILSLKTMGIIDVYGIDYIDHPGKERLDKAITTLSLLGALRPDGRLTDEGKEMVQLPIDPHLARMMVEAKKQGCVEATSIVAGFLNSGKSVFAFNPKTENFQKKYGKYMHEDSDFLTLLNIWNAYSAEPEANRWQWAMDNGFSPSVLNDAQTIAEELLQEDLFSAMATKPLTTPIGVVGQSEAIRKSVAAGFMDRLLEQTGEKVYKFKHGGKSGIVLDSSSVLLYPDEKLNPKKPLHQEDQLEEPLKKKAPLIISGNIRTQEKTGRTTAGLNQVVSEELIDEIAPYIKLFKEAQQQEELRIAAEKKAEEMHKIEQQAEFPLPPQPETKQEQKKKEENISFPQKIKRFFHDLWKNFKSIFSKKGKTRDDVTEVVDYYE